MSQSYLILWTILLGVAVAPIRAQDAAKPTVPQSSSCLKCHGESDLWEGDRRKFFVTEADLAGDLHWQKGIRCEDCHGGDPKSLNFREAHSADAGYRIIETPKDIPAFCGHCHSDPQYMSRYLPSPKTNQEVDYWTGDHGRPLKALTDEKAKKTGVASCTSCHGYHGIQAVNDPTSPTYPTNVAKTCASCHSDPQKMAGIEYNGRPIGHDQYDLWKTSVHAKLLLEKGDLSAPTCNDCHGNHGSVAPDVNSVASACATCHGKIGSLFETTVMKHRFEQINLPGCATCHSSHAIQQPSDEMIGMEEGAVCATCHVGGKFGAPVAGAFEAKKMRDALTSLKQEIAHSESMVDEAERLGMEVRKAKFRLHDARTALSNVRVEVHSFALQPLQDAIDKGLGITQEVEANAQQALQEYTFRRVWLGLSLIPIGVVVILLLLYIRTLPSPTVEDLGH